MNFFERFQWCITERLHPALGGLVMVVLAQLAGILLALALLALWYWSHS